MENCDIIRSKMVWGEAGIWYNEICKHQQIKFWIIEVLKKIRAIVMKLGNIEKFNDCCGIACVKNEVTNEDWIVVYAAIPAGTSTSWMLINNLMLKIYLAWRIY